jgi:hypothetical protein
MAGTSFPSTSSGGGGGALKRKFSDIGYTAPGFKICQRYHDEITGKQTTITLTSDDFDLSGKQQQQQHLFFPHLSYFSY